MTKGHRIAGEPDVRRHIRGLPQIAGLRYTPEGKKTTKRGGIETNLVSQVSKHIPPDLPVGEPLPASTDSREEQQKTRQALEDSPGLQI
jgi:hypothetical protein